MSTDITVTNQGTTNVNSTMDIMGLNDIKVREELVLPQPFQTDSKSRTELAITQPIVTDSTSDLALDIKPIAVDLCININFGGIPPTCMRFPYQTHFGITLFGVEVLGFSLSGESRVIIEDVPGRPQVALGGEFAPGRPMSRRTNTQQEPGGGLRIRFDR